MDRTVLRAYPQSWFSWKFRVLDDRDRHIAHADISGMARPRSLEKRSGIVIVTEQ
jgi:hypothetical protein